MYVYDKKSVVNLAEEKPKLTSFILSYFIIIYFIMVGKDHKGNFQYQESNIIIKYLVNKTWNWDKELNFLNKISTIFEMEKLNFFPEQQNFNKWKSRT